MRTIFQIAKIIEIPFKIDYSFLFILTMIPLVVYKVKKDRFERFI